MTFKTAGWTDFACCRSLHDVQLCVRVHVAAMLITLVTNASAS